MSYGADLQAAMWFIQALTGDINVKCIFQIIDNDKERIKRNEGMEGYCVSWSLYGTLDELKDELCIRNADRYGIYVTINESSTTRRVKQDMVRVRAVFHEDDKGYRGAFPLMPTVTVETSIGKYHRYWLVEDNWTPDDEYANVQKCLVRHFEGDKQARDICRVMRVPGFYNWKYGEPFMVRIAPDVGAKHTRAQLVAAFPAPANPTGDVAPREPRAPLRSEQLPRYRAAAAATLRGAAADVAGTPRGGRELALFTKAAHVGVWWREGLLEHADIVAAFAHACRVNGYLSEHDGGHMLRQIERGLAQGADNDDLPDLDAAAKAALGSPTPNLESIADFPTLLERLARMSEPEWLPLADKLRRNHGLTAGEFRRQVRQRAADIRRAERMPGAACVVDKTKPDVVAEAFMASLGGRLVYWNEEFYIWKGGYYECIDDGQIKSWLRGFLRGCKRETRDGNLADFHPTKDVVTEIFTSLTQLTYINTQFPCFSHPNGNDIKDVINFANGWLNIKSGILYQPTDTLLTRTMLPFPYTPQAPTPHKFFKFLSEIWQTEAERNEFIPQLRRMFAYLLTPGNDLQKIFVFMGVSRSGKSTIVRIIETIVGLANCEPMNSSDFAKNTFALDPVRGKSVIIFPDMRISKENRENMTERLLSVSGGDRQSINRKRKTVVQERLNCKIIIVSNDIPDLPDDSGALAARYVPFRFVRSFAGRENPGLFAELEAEAPGILSWALGALGELTQPQPFALGESAAEVRSAVRDANSPLSTFAEQCLVAAPDVSAPCNAVYAAYVFWIKSIGGNPVNALHFGRKLRGVMPQVTRRQVTGGAWEYRGIALQPPANPAP